MKLDRKFYGELRKMKDDSLVPEDQWVAFLVKDNAFAALVQGYPMKCIELDCDAEQIAAAAVLVERINEWRGENQDKLKKPDAAGERLLP